MNVGQVIAEFLKREGVDILFTYPLNPLTESAAAVDIRPLVVRQERVGCAMADAIGRMTLRRQGQRVLLPARARHRERVRLHRAGVFRRRAARRRRRRHDARPALHEAVLQLVAELPARHEARRDRSTTPEMLVPALRRAFSIARNGRPGPSARRSAGRHVERGGAGRRSSIAPTRRMLSAPDAAVRRRGRRGAARGANAADLCGAGRPLREGVARAQGSSPSCSRRPSRRASKARARFPRIIRCRSARAAARCRAPSRCT